MTFAKCLSSTPNRGITHFHLSRVSRVSVLPVSSPIPCPRKPLIYLLSHGFVCSGGSHEWSQAACALLLRLASSAQRKVEGVVPRRVLRRRSHPYCHILCTIPLNVASPILSADSKPLTALLHMPWFDVIEISCCCGRLSCCFGAISGRRLWLCR